jgi:hypothetical protein
MLARQSIADYYEPPAAIEVLDDIRLELSWKRFSTVFNGKNTSLQDDSAVVGQDISDIIKSVLSTEQSKM